VELHGRAFSNPYLLPAEATRRMLEQRQSVDIGGAPVCIPAADDLFIYLCLHGAVHGWACLKWLCDVAALLTPERPADWEGVARRAVELGLQRPIAQAAQLAELLLDTPAPAPMSALAGQDTGVTPLVGHALRGLLPRGRRGLWGKISRFATNLSYDLRLKPDRRYRSHMVRAVWIAPRLWNFWRLPDALFPLYYLARPIASYVPARGDELPPPPGV
jgi:hypothetical protein